MQRYETLEDFDRVIIDTANRSAGRTSDGKEGPVLFAYAALNLATGASENRLAARHFIRTVQEAARRQEVREQQRWEAEHREARREAFEDGGAAGLAEFDARHR
ncbi:hypothetical protein ASE85_04865 [Sphingobium sp. Leaf26]|nr:hypothetical protein ASE85_04865 [Sphingobium sp. Leaf26]